MVRFLFFFNPARTDNKPAPAPPTRHTQEGRERKATTKREKKEDRKQKQKHERQGCKTRYSSAVAKSSSHSSSETQSMRPARPDMLYNSNRATN